MVIKSFLVGAFFLDGFFIESANEAVILEIVSIVSKFFPQGAKGIDDNTYQ
jgi:hypothetical protein